MRITDSTVFQVKDPDAFMLEFSKYDIPLRINKHKDNCVSMYMEHGEWPQSLTTAEGKEVDFLDCIAPHLTGKCNPLLMTVEPIEKKGIFINIVGVTSDGDHIYTGMTPKDIYFCYQDYLEEYDPEEVENETDQ